MTAFSKSELLKIAYKAGMRQAAKEAALRLPTWKAIKPWALPIGVTSGLGALTGALMPGGDEDDIHARMGRGALFGGGLGTTLAALRGHEFQQNIPWLLPLLMTAPWIIGDPHGVRHRKSEGA
jgi:hypothetical protein